MRTPSQNEIAREAGVSRSTVAWALHPTRRHKLRAETLQRVVLALERLHYRPHRYAQVMRRGRSGIIGLLRFAGYSQMRSELEHHTLQGIREGGFKPLVIRSLQSPSHVAATCEELLDAQIEGLVIEGPNFSETQDVVQRFRKAQVPLVILSGSQVPDTSHVCSDMRAGMADLTRHLLQLRHKRLCLLIKWADPQVYRYDWWRNYDKILGFADALHEANATLTDVDGRLAQLHELNPLVAAFPGTSDVVGQVSFDVGEWHWFDPFREGSIAAEKLLRQGPRPTALLCTNDDWAIGAMSVCHRNGTRVPRDLAITGIDNYSVGQYLDVPLTTVSQPTAEKAATAVKVLLEIMRDQRSEPETIKLPTTLVVRESCGAKLLTR